MKHSCLGVFLAFLFVIFFIFSFVLFNLRSTFFSENFWKTALVKSQIYEEIPKIVEKEILEKQKGVESDEQLKQIVKENFTPQWLKKETETNLHNFFIWLYGKSQSLKIVIDTSGFKQKFDQMLEKMYQSLPACTAQQMAELKKQGVEIGCRIPGKNFQSIKKEFYAKTEGLSELKDAIVIEKFGPSYKFKNDSERFFAKSPLIFKNLNYILYGLAGFTLLFLILIIVLARESLRSIFRWTGIPLMIASFGFLLISGFGKIILLSVTKNLDTWSAASPDASRLVNSFFNAFFSQILSTVLWQSLVVFGLGLVLLILSFFFKKPETAAVTAVKK